MNQTPWQPDFQIRSDTAGIPSTEYDNLSTEDIMKLVNAAQKIKTGKQGNLHYTPPPPPKKEVDIDAIIASGGKEC